MEDEVGGLLQDALVGLVERRDRQLDRLLADLARAGADALVSSSAVYEPSGRSSARCATVRQSAGAKHETRARVARGPARPHAHEQRVAVAVVAELLDGERVPGRLAFAPELLRASGSRTTPRRSRASPLAPRRSSKRASGRDRSAASCTIAAGSGCVAKGHPQRAQLVPERRQPAGSSCRIEASSAACAIPSASATCRRCLRRPRRSPAARPPPRPPPSARRS